jgi:nucleoside-diphosphate-sugar epimerase
MLAVQFGLEANRPVTILRPFAVYGPWEDESRLVPRAVLAALGGGELPLTGGARRDFVFVGDVIDAAVAAALADVPAGEIINVGTGRATSNDELVASLERATGAAVRVLPDSYERRAWDAGAWVADVSKADRALGWCPSHTLDEGLRTTFAWFRDRAESDDRAAVA